MQEDKVRKEVLFLKKKNQKNFCSFRARVMKPLGAKLIKVFCGTGVGVPPFLQSSDRFLPVAFP
jgi:hypothetical protein